MKAETPNPAWMHAGNRRRSVLLALILIPSLLAATIMYSLLPAATGLLWNSVITALFAVLFSWISVGFWSSLAGCVIVFNKVDKYSVTANLPESCDLPDDFRTALLFPVYNEDTRMVAEGIRTVIASLRELGVANHFDTFILSDSTDPEAWVREEEAWYSLVREENAFGRIFYRRRRSNLKRKSGNIADFCRRWGANYRYMIVFDADSVMAGKTLARMVQAMEAHTDIGILQTPPKAFGSRSLIARVQQFANHLYGPIFAAGLHYWQLGDAQYWGHNAIIRTAPFMEFCQLPTLPGRSPLGGDIMSHDFVESALMRRAGYGVWLGYDLDGSYEQCPPTLIDELIRDKRWCQGNLQHSRLLFTRGFFPTHRALFINGIMSYGSALLWFFFLIASSAQAMAEIFVVPTYFPSGPSLFPDWPQYFPRWALTLLSSTAALLFLPKIFALILVAVRGGAKHFGGVAAMTFSVIGEVVISTLLAPVRMLFHSYFVVTTLLGSPSGWNTQNRSQETTWGDAVRFHWWGTLLGLLWGGVMYLANPGFFLWLSPIIIGLAVSIPLSVLTSRVRLGNGARLIRLFTTPPDVEPPKELAFLKRNIRKPLPPSPFELARDKGFMRAVVIPRVFFLHMTLNGHQRKNSAKKQAWLASLTAKALAYGPGSLNAKEKIAILSDPECLRNLHDKVWQLDVSSARRWGIV
ncbi:glucan biosynthesis: glycosyl transferase [uncultured delta proteobacterium]|uniref:Glucans biosynthesis glucosyltransferase H n=1 Tax=uncultured delta proteobacterium TaxID=34034 RepID=A0A212J8B1_9DELT|nr:glucan biosynthesis: glycosyl transferase [uncultured delta proteobacterium]